MRKIEFRGQRVDNGEWVYGCLTRYSEAMSFITVDFLEIDGKVYEVHTKTLGQFTGLLGKNGKKIYEGDICTKYYKRQLRKYIVKYYQQAFRGLEINGDYDFCIGEVLGGFEIIGTIHDIDGSDEG